MRQSIKAISLLISTLICGAMILTGCNTTYLNKNNILKADVTAEALYNFYVLGDSSKVEELGINTPEVLGANDSIKEHLATLIRKCYSSDGFCIEEASINDMVNAQLDTCKKLTHKVEVISEDEDMAEVKITSNHIEIGDIYSKAEDDATDKVSAMNLRDLRLENNKFFEMFTDNFVNYCKEVEPSTELEEHTYVFYKQNLIINGNKNQVWMPDNIQLFSEDIISNSINH